ncbi:Uncharacterised protein [Segatella copri]|nr:Uncharacterised protein [Segatella copri]
MFHQFCQLVGMSFVIILEYVLTEFLDLSYDIPTLIIINIFFDIIHNPEK